MYNTTKLTLELRDLVENGVDIWDFDYPSFYQGEEKKAFEKKVIDHFYFRQIGQETPGRFLHYFRARINEIMPYYKRMYETVQIMDNVEDPFGNVDITETYEETSSGTASGTGTGTQQGSANSTTTQTVNNEHRMSNTPQSSIDNLDNYMTEASKDNNSQEDSATGSSTNTTTSESTSQSSGTVKHTLTRKGNQGVNTYAHDIIEFRKSIIDVDMMIINNLQDLFLGVY